MKEYVNKSEERTVFLCDVFTCIVEDFGYNSWRYIDSYDPDLSIATIVVPDEYEDGEEEIFHINLYTVEKGIAVAIETRFDLNSESKKQIKLADITNDAIDLDVFDADSILQAAIFGELVYG